MVVAVRVAVLVLVVLSTTVAGALPEMLKVALAPVAAVPRLSVPLSIRPAMMRRSSNL